MTAHNVPGTLSIRSDRRVGPPQGLSAFFVITFAFSWLVWWLGPLLVPDDGATLALIIVGSFGPAIGAVVVTAQSEGRPGLKSLFGRYLPRQQGGARPFLVGALVFLVLLASGGIALVTGSVIDPEGLQAGLLALPGSIILIALIGGGNEELGWRGFALPRLQAAMSPVAANIMLGIIWAVWHAPLWSMATSQAEMSFPLYVIIVVAISLVLGFIFNIACGGLLAVVVAHTAVNSAGGLKAAALGNVNEVHELLAISLIALIILIATGGRLGLSESPGGITQKYAHQMAWLGVVVLGAMSTWFAWMGWDQSYWTDPATGLEHGPYRGWQVAGCVLSLLVIAVLASWGRHWWTVLLLPPSFALAWSLTAAAEDVTGLWAVGALVVLLGTTVGTLVVLGVTRGVRQVIQHRR